MRAGPLGSQHGEGTQDARRVAGGTTYAGYPKLCAEPLGLQREEGTQDVRRTAGAATWGGNSGCAQDRWGRNMGRELRMRAGPLGPQHG